MGDKICFYEETWLIIPKLSLFPLLIWSTDLISGPAPYRGYHDGPDDFPPPPPPPSNYMDQNFPPPPPETRENIYHEIRDDFPPPPAGPPPPVTGASSGDDYRGPEPMFLRPGGKNLPKTKVSLY